MTLYCSNEYLQNLEFDQLQAAAGHERVDFRFKEGDNHDLGSVFIYVTNVGPEADHPITYPGRKKFSDGGRKAIKRNHIYLIRNDNAKVDRQFDFFMEDKPEGLTQARMTGLN